MQAGLRYLVQNGISGRNGTLVKSNMKNREVLSGSEDRFASQGSCGNEEASEDMTDPQQAPAPNPYWSTSGSGPRTQTDLVAASLLLLPDSIPPQKALCTHVRSPEHPCPNSVYSPPLQSPLGHPLGLGEHTWRVV